MIRAPIQVFRAANLENLPTSMSTRFCTISRVSLDDSDLMELCDQIGTVFDEKVTDEEYFASFSSYPQRCLRRPRLLRRRRGLRVRFRYHRVFLLFSLRSHAETKPNGRKAAPGTFISTSHALAASLKPSPAKLFLGFHVSTFPRLGSATSCSEPRNPRG